MKIIQKLLCILFILSFQISFAQSSKTLGTTIEEYNYVTKGYKVQLESGLDMKKGYEFNDITTIESEGRRVVYKELIKDGKDLRAIMAIFTGKDSYTSYFCIPLGDYSSDIKNAYYSSVATGIDNVAAMNFYQLSLTSLLSIYLTK